MYFSMLITQGIIPVGLLAVAGAGAMAKPFQRKIAQPARMAAQNVAAGRLPERSFHLGSLKNYCFWCETLVF